jgi:endonuclease/exonuclease/phosphatase family metal-dependent hydrolase
MIPLKVMTFNLRGSYFEIDGDNFWDYRADLNIRTLHKYMPDIISFQEFQQGNLEVYHHYLADYDYHLGLVTIDDSEFGMYNAIYWRRERFLPLDSGGFYLSPTPDEFSNGWDSALIRACNWVKFRDAWTNTEFIYVNVHLDHLGETARVEGSKLVVSKIADIRDDLPVIITGDFNSRAWASPDEDLTNLPAGVVLEDLAPPNTAHKVYTDAGYADTFILAGHEESNSTNTFHSFMGEAYPPMAVRIDWILISGGAKQFTTHSCEIIRDAEPPVFPSDHYPVQTELSVT